MKYENAIINILLEAGSKGLPVSKIARHVHHGANSLFVEVAYEEVYKSVRQFVRANSQTSYSLFEHCEKHGYYRINPNSTKLRQQRLEWE